jgi:phosphomannomutase/phosphoglucomutase
VFAGQSIRELLTINGVRVTVDDGTWGLIRASSNKPDLVVVAESPVSLERRNAMLHAINDVLARFEAGQLPDFEGALSGDGSYGI